MNPLLLLVLAILTPFLLLAALLLPVYGTVVGACYIIYDTGAKIHPLTSRLLDVFYIIDVYSKLFTYWYAHKDSLSLIHYALPVAALPLAGTLFALWLTRRIALKMMDVFHVFGGGH